MDQKAVQTQQNIMQLVERQLGGKDYLLDWLKNHFGLAKASAYRRINGEVLLNLQELLLLIDTFKLPTAEILEENNDLFYFELNTNEPTTYIDWLEGMERRFTKLTDLPNCRMLYSSNENPVFDYFHFDELTHFKLFIWAKTVWDFPDLQDQPFSLQSELWTKEASDTKDRILDTYQRVPSIEFWTPNILNNNINQIKYYLESYQFEDRHDALLLCDQLRSMLKILQEQTRLGQKSRRGVAGDGAKFTLYYNEMLHTNNTILFQFDGGKAMYSTFGNPNTIETRQASACDYIEDWFGKLRQRCHRISSESERDRFRLFRQMEEKINKAEQLFKGMI